MIHSSIILYILPLLFLSGLPVSFSALFMETKRTKKFIFVLFVIALILLVFAGALIVGIFHLPERLICRHETWQNGVCIVCGYECRHSKFDNGVCTVCGFRCSHSAHDEFGLCTVCGGDCQHLRHDPNELFCLRCGQRIRHDFTNGVCPICGKSAEEELYCLDQFFWMEPPECGTTVTVQYDAPDYSVMSEDLTEKSMQIYLPYGYTPEKQYNVLVLMHGSGGDERYWFGRDHSYTYPDTDYVDSFSFTHLLDNMIYYRYCAPLIVVSPTLYLNDAERARGNDMNRDISQLRFELQKDILPYVAEHYSTYAASPSYADLCLARDHFGFIGASYGATLTYSSVLCYDADIFSWFGAVSGCACDVPAVCSYLENSSASLPVNYFYASAGDSEAALQESYSGYQELLAFSSSVNSSNSSFATIRNASHEDRVWDNGVYNCLLKFFR